ncbi:MAG: 2-oxo acid dehydrogenase subunit E2 [Solirubrobacterales bacterium]|nr:2-oxo acid dehydrogenase subunit E2 [Solirubrobacterales bacterium]
MSEITMPRLSESMVDGTIIRWLKHDGQDVVCDEELVEIETDKAVMTYAAPVSGTLHVVAPEGSTIAVGEPIAQIGLEAAQDDRPPAPVSGTADVPMPPPEAMAASTRSSIEANGSVGAGRDGGSRSATPLARRTARAHNVALEQLDGTGPRGRITRADVLAAARITTQPSPELIEPTRVQQVIARRMTQANGTPDFAVQTEVAMDATIELRARLKDVADDEPAPSINDFIVKSCAIALRHHPRVNGSYVDGHFRLHGNVNVGVAVAREDALVVPVVHDADTKSLRTIASVARRLSDRVRTGAITPDELSGATFTVSNLGMFGMTAIHPVIDPPQAAILGVGAVRDTLARIDGEIRDHRLMTLTLVADHRILYGADAARFLAEIAALLETPLRLLL